MPTILYDGPERNYERYCLYNDYNYKEVWSRKGFGLKLPEPGFQSQLPKYGERYPLIPRDEWPERIREMNAKRMWIKDRIRFTSFDQNGLGYCTTEDTEILTETGWVRWPDLQNNVPIGTVNPATNALEFQYPLAKQVFEYNGELVCSDNRRIKFAVTPNHRMYVRKWNERKRTLDNKYSFVKAKNLGWYTGLMHSPQSWSGVKIRSIKFDNRTLSGDDFIRLISLVVSDGFAGASEKSWNTVSFACFNKNQRKVREFAKKIGFKEQPQRPGVWSLHCLPQLAKWFRNNAYCGNSYNAETKCIPQIIRHASSQQIKIFLEWYGDKSHNNRDDPQFYSVSKKLIDGLQELHLRIGKRSSISHKEPRTSCFNNKIIRSKKLFTLCVSKTNRLCLERKRHIEQDKYCGNVYCATVPNGTLITRQNDTVLISGNCWVYCVAQAMTALRDFQGHPHARISACSIGGPIKNYVNEGGWPEEALMYAIEHGGVTEKYWPNLSLDRNLYNQTLQHRIHKVFRAYRADRESFDEIATAAFNGHASTTAFMWWMHAIMGGVRIIDLDGTDRWGHEIRNSWGENTGTANIHGVHGFQTFEVAGNSGRGNPDDVTILVDVTATTI